MPDGTPGWYREARRLAGSARWVWRERGPRYFAGDVADMAVAYATYPVRRRQFANEAFELGGRRLLYARHHYNRAWRNERSVELALAFEFLAHARGRVLEVGNVLAHYGCSGHDVLDKYEESPGVVNADIVDFVPDKPYDAILSISTLEHVGWDERPREPDKPLRAYRNLRAMLAPEGTMLVTCPLGQNPHLDAMIQAGELDFPVRHYLLRTNAHNDWQEAGLAEVAGARYGSPYRNANALFVGIVPGVGEGQRPSPTGPSDD
jgi:hypothetical protein